MVFGERSFYWFGNLQGGEMYSTVSLNQMAERDLQEFEGDLKRYQRANRRSMWVGIGALFAVLFSACMVCSAVVLILR